MPDEKRITVRVPGPLYRAMARQAEQSGVNVSEQIRRLVTASKPHYAVLQDVARILDAGKAAAERGEPYAPFLRNCERRLETGLEELKRFDNLAAEWRQEAQAELSDCLAHLRQMAQQHQWTGELMQLLGKTLPREGQDEHRA